MLRKRIVLALLFFAGATISIARFYRAAPPHESTPPGLRELLLSSVQKGGLDLTRLRLASPWNRVCVLPSGTGDEEALRKLPFLIRGWNLSDHSNVAKAPVTVVLLFGPGPTPVGVADLPNGLIQFGGTSSVCFARNTARFLSN